MTAFPPPWTGGEFPPPEGLPGGTPGCGFPPGPPVCVLVRGVSGWSDDGPAMCVGMLGARPAGAPLPEATAGLVASAIVAQAQSKSAPRRARMPPLKASLSANPCASLSRCDAKTRHFGCNRSGQQRIRDARKRFPLSSCYITLIEWLILTAVYHVAGNDSESRSYRWLNGEPLAFVVPEVSLPSRFHRALEKPLRSLFSSARSHPHINGIGAFLSHIAVIGVDSARLVINFDVLVFVRHARSNA